MLVQTTNHGIGKQPYLDLGVGGVAEADGLVEVANLVVDVVGLFSEKNMATLTLQQHLHNRMLHHYFLHCLHKILQCKNAETITIVC